MTQRLDSNLVVINNSLYSWGDLLREGKRTGMLGQLESSTGAVALVVNDHYQAFVAVACTTATQTSTLIIGSERLSPQVRDLIEQHGFLWFDYRLGKISPNRAAATCHHPSGHIAMLTSGSTGTPKIVEHTWRTLFTARESQEVQMRRWLVPYQIATYAWYQIVTLGLFQAGQTLVSGFGADPVDCFRLSREHGVDSISATPSFWRMAMLYSPSELMRSLRLKFVTIGGEIVDQVLLDRLSYLYPKAQITHIYATTEAGASIIVRDGLAGFPVNFLCRNDPSLPKVKIPDGRLLIQSHFSTKAANGHALEWIDTGDLVEIRGSRVHFLGRADSALINVGGNKAYPADIEAVLLKHPAVSWCKVRAVRSKFIGHLPEADLVFAAGKIPPSDSDLIRYSMKHLPEYAIPRFWNRLKEIPQEFSLKARL